MKSKIKILALILLLSVIGNGIQCYFLCQKPKTILRKTDKIEKTIDTIYLENTILLKEFNNSKNELNIIEKEYEEDYNYILDQSIDSAYLFFTEYLRLQEERGVFDTNYREPIKTN